MTETITEQGTKWTERTMVLAVKHTLDDPLMLREKITEFTHEDKDGELSLNISGELLFRYDGHTISISPQALVRACLQVVEEAS